ncbi:MAG: ROK family protein [Clostridia bacterium]|nr:ROK family protein [Clostridia bacterium]MDE7328585.1 ROK family protein [Clostridia bacterium]
MYLIGIDVGGMSIKGGLVTQEGNILFKTTLPTAEKYNDSHGISEDIRKVIDAVIQGAKVSVDQIKGIGIGQPGSIDSKNGVIRYSNNIALENVPVIAQLKKYYDLPIYINNDANCAALGEHVFGAGKGYNDVVFVTLGTGVGTGFIIDGKLFEGKDCAGTEGGHMQIDISDSACACTCGRKGCWEAYASATALIRQTKSAMDGAPNSLMHKLAKEEGKVSGKTAFCAAKAGDEAGQKVVDKYIDYVTSGLINLVNIFYPDAILIGGGISNEKEYLTQPIQKAVNAARFGAKYTPDVVIKTASLKNDAGILGAAALAL